MMDTKSFGSCKPPAQKPPISCSTLALTLTLFAIAAVTILAALYFSVFKPTHPSIQISSIHVLSLSPAGFPSAITSVNLTLIATLSLHNPNRARFKVQHGSVASLYYYDERVGSSWLGERTVEGRSTMAMDLELTVDGPTPLQGLRLYRDVAEGVLQNGVSVWVRGEVGSPLTIFSLQSCVLALCSVNVSLNSRGIEAYSCQGSFPVQEAG